MERLARPPKRRSDARPPDTAAGYTNATASPWRNVETEGRVGEEPPAWSPPSQGASGWRAAEAVTLLPAESPPSQAGGGAERVASGEEDVRLVLPAWAAKKKSGRALDGAVDAPGLIGGKESTHRGQGCYFSQLTKISPL